jgi:hypothetical protein
MGSSLPFKFKVMVRVSKQENDLCQQIKDCMNKMEFNLYRFKGSGEQKFLDLYKVKLIELNKLTDKLEFEVNSSSIRG